MEIFFSLLKRTRSSTNSYSYQQEASAKILVSSGILKCYYISKASVNLFTNTQEELVENRKMSYFAFFHFTFEGILPETQLPL